MEWGLMWVMFVHWKDADQKLDYSVLSWDINEGIGYISRAS
jgi:hypothetical protein